MDNRTGNETLPITYKVIGSLRRRRPCDGGKAALEETTVADSIRLAERRLHEVAEMAARDPCAGYTPGTWPRTAAGRSIPGPCAAPGDTARPGGGMAQSRADDPAQPRADHPAHS